MTNVYAKKISQAIIEYLIHSAGYSHHEVAILTNLPVETIIAIYNRKISSIPLNFHLKLLKLYGIAVNLT